MKAIFISDAHLKRKTDDRYGQLMNFFNDIKEGKVRLFIEADGTDKILTGIDDLYIVGDLFDFWFCDKGNINPEFILIIHKLIELQKAGIRIHLNEGNHDFLLREYFHDVLGMEVFEEWADVKINGIRALIGHGDTTDKANFKYLLFRKILRSRLFYHFQRFIPARVRGLLRRRQGVPQGHPDHGAGTAGKKKTFVSLGDWIKHYSFLYYENKNFILGYYRPS